MDESERLLDDLARLIDANGPDDFVFAPILTPDPRYFPDAWTGDLKSAEAMLQRLMSWARLGSLQLSLRLESDPGWHEESDYEPPHRDAAAFFAGVNSFGTYLFGVRPDQLDEPMTLAGILAHETAHAWRFRRDITSTHDATEERLTDVSSVFLGFGVLSSAIAHRNDAELRRRGYLPMAAVCFALGVQLVVRNDEAEWKRVDDALFHDARDLVRRTRSLYRDHRAELLERLRLPPEATWKKKPPPKLPPPWSPDVRAGRDLVFRVKAPPFLQLGSALVGLGGLIAAANLTPWPLVLVALTPLAWFFERDVCSAEGCGAPLSRGVARCRACGGDVVGRIRRKREHAKAEQTFLEQQGGVASAARDVVKDLLSNARKPE